MKNIIWLASYPKSGNTWIRVFLMNLLNDSDTPADINKLETNDIASARQFFDDYLGIEASDLTFDEIDNLRPELYLHVAELDEGTLLIKIHDAYSLLPDGRPLIPKEATKAVLYIVRNPLDVAISFADHSSYPIDKMIKVMNDNSTAVCSRNDRIANQLRQKLFTWSSHVLSWINNTELNFKIVRYEDLINTPVKTFTGIAKFLEFDYDPVKIEKAIRFSDFKELQRQENEDNFGEKPPGVKNFFRKGKTGDWKNTLTNEQIETIVNDHKEVMIKLGYLSSKGEILC